MSKAVVHLMRAMDFAARKHRDQRRKGAASEPYILRAILASPPFDWDSARKRDYFEWAAKVVAGCRGVNRALEAQFDEAYQSGLAAFQRGNGG